MNIRDFAEQYGISAIARRHFAYRKPVSDDELGGYPIRGALTYMRAFDRGRLGLTHAGSVKAFEQGICLGAMHIVPHLIIVGDDQRNLDGGFSTAEGIKEAAGADIPVLTSPAVTYPHYTYFGITRDCLGKFEDYAVHRYLGGQDLLRLWSEPPAVFEARVTAAVLADYNGAPILFDLNFEQITLLYFLHVRGIRREEIPCGKKAWKPTMGGGIVYSADREVAMEFAPDFSMVIEVVE